MQSVNGMSYSLINKVHTIGFKIFRQNKLLRIGIAAECYAFFSFFGGRKWTAMYLSF